MPGRLAAGSQALNLKTEVRILPWHLERINKMLRVVLELVPYGLEEYTRRLYTIEIANVRMVKNYIVTKCGPWMNMERK